MPTDRLWKAVRVSTGVMVADWIKRLVDDERRRDAVRAREEEAAARKADLVRVHGRRLIKELRATVTRDVEAFRHEFAGDPGRDIVCEDAEPEGGFVVRKPESPAVSLSVAPHLEAAAVRCQYRFTSNNGLPRVRIASNWCSPATGSRRCRSGTSAWGRCLQVLTRSLSTCLYPFLRAVHVSSNTAGAIPMPSYSDRVRRNDEHADPKQEPPPASQSFTANRVAERQRFPKRPLKRRQHVDAQIAASRAARTTGL